MSNPVLIRAAARSNAEWCHVFTGTYGIEGLFHATSLTHAGFESIGELVVWVSSAPSPPR